jgi:hypothetical protein
MQRPHALAFFVTDSLRRSEFANRQERASPTAILRLLLTTLCGHYAATRRQATQGLWIQMTLALQHIRQLLLTAVLAAAALAIIQPAHAAPESPARAEATKRLFNAVYANDFAAVQASVAGGADVDWRNAWGVSAVDLAVDKGYFRIAHYLVSVRSFQRTKAEQVAAANPEAPIAAPAPAPVASLAEQGGREKSGKTAQLPPAEATTTEMRQPPASDWPQMNSTAINPFDPAQPAFGTLLLAGAESG